ncbi:hypothetical protein ABFS83_08G208800 [Erythranthe nasuta]
MQRNGNSTSACASCKHQRKKCTDKCTLAPFFPVEKSREFQAVHKVFGVSNITKIITSLKEEDRKIAVDSLVWEALCRYKDPVLGPYGDYRRVCEELRLFKAQFQQFQQLPPQELMGNWTNTKVINNINTNNFQSNGSFCPYGYTEKLCAESGSASALIIPHNRLPNPFNQQFFLAGQYNPMDSKSMESTLWEASS